MALIVPAITFFVVSVSIGMIVGAFVAFKKS